MEADVRRQAHQLIASGKSQQITFTLDDDFGDQNGMICGGQCDVAIMVMTPAPTSPTSPTTNPITTILDELASGKDSKLTIEVDTGNNRVAYNIRLDAQPHVIIAGGGHISRILAKLLHPLGFRITVIDDRPEYANTDRFPSPMNPVVGNIANTLQRQHIDSATYIVIVTRGHRHDLEALAAVINKPANYIGMIGSRRKIKVIYDDLRHAGISDESLKRIHAPIGININSVTTNEIALSIAAQLVSIRRKDHPQSVEGPFNI